MTNPSSQTITKETWTKVATSVKTGQIWFLDSSPDYYHTFRDTGDPVPTGDPSMGPVAFLIGAKKVSEKNIGGSLPIGTNVDSDIYIYCADADGRIIVEV